FVGMAAGTYSSIFLATPLEVALRNREPKIREHTQRVLDRRTAAAAAGQDDGVGLAALAGLGAVQAGRHLGAGAQPRRKSRSKR
ncbi:MAG: hypothetical protein LBO75_00690, partial [Bifidobacteriaceae bacterium]|nr:hypothetical protein [Bifidobacteriaceae bacterium]